METRPLLAMTLALPAAGGPVEAGRRCRQVVDGIASPRLSAFLEPMVAQLVSAAPLDEFGSWQVELEVWPHQVRCRVADCVGGEQWLDLEHREWGLAVNGRMTAQWGRASDRSLWFTLDQRGEAEAA